MQLVVEEYGTFVGKTSERLRVSKGKEVLQEVPLMDLEQVLILSAGVSLSSDAVRACAERGISINFLSRSGKPYARLMCAEIAGGGTVSTRRAQLLAYTDQRGVGLAQAFAVGKIHNQAALLKYMAKYRKQANNATYQTVLDEIMAVEKLAGELAGLTAADVDDLRPHLFNREGRAAQHYWRAVSLLLREGTDWPGREGRGAADPFNMALNYGYGILYSQMEGALLLAGLDPYAGFIHTDRAGKPSLVLDAIEEFRAPVVDRAVVAIFNKGMELKVEAESGRFDQASRRLIAERVTERLETTETYQGKKHKLRSIIQMQARRMATFLRGEGSYQPFKMQW